MGIGDTDGGAAKGHNVSKIILLVALLLLVMGSLAVILSRPKAATTPGITVPVSSAAKKTLLDLQGSGSKLSQQFSAPENWELTWSYDCTGLSGPGTFYVSVLNTDGTHSSLVAINQGGTGRANGTEQYHLKGRFSLEINSQCQWRLTAKG